MNDIGYFGRQKLTLKESMMADKRMTDKQKLYHGNEIVIINKYLNNYGAVLEVKTNDPTKGIVTVKDGLGSSEGYFYEDFEIRNQEHKELPINNFKN